jgi:hypothetical protein
MKLKSGKEITLKAISLDNRDEMLDTCRYETNDKGEISEMKAPHSTITKWIRLAVEDATDEFILGLDFEERTEIFIELQKNIFVGEGNASDSK